MLAMNKNYDVTGDPNRPENYYRNAEIKARQFVKDWKFKIERGASVGAMRDALWKIRAIPADMKHEIDDEITGEL